MLCRKFTQITLKPTANNVTIRSIIPARQFSKKCIDIFTFVRLRRSSVRMSSTLRLRNILRDLVVTRLFSAWTRSYIVSSVIKRCRKERGVRDVLQCFRQTILRPRRTLLFAVTAAYKNHDEKPGKPGPCANSITDEELQELVSEFEGVELLAQATLYCKGCAKRVVIDNKQPGVPYCPCKSANPPEQHYDGWFPYMEAQDIIIWRKEYKGKGMYAYKVYGRYNDILAQDFAAIQVDGAYRRIWDTAVAALSIVERQANEIKDQIILHWEVVWPRLFANRDYVYMRRHKEFDIETKCMPHKDGIFNETPCVDETAVSDDVYVKPSVHSKAKRKAMEEDKKKEKGKAKLQQKDKAYIIVSRSCVHPQVPESRNAVRVTEYWSHMVVKTTNGSGKPGMEFVLTYYDEPAVGGMPSGVASWATGRAAPAFIERMRNAAISYSSWRGKHDQQVPDFTPFGPEKVSYDMHPFNEQDMESSKSGPDLEPVTREKATQTDDVTPPPRVRSHTFSTYDVAQVSRPWQDKSVNTDGDKDSLDNADEKKPKPPPPPVEVKPTNETAIHEKTQEKTPEKLPEKTEKTPENSAKTTEETEIEVEITIENTKDSELEGDDTTKEESEIAEEATVRWWRSILPHLAADYKS